MYSYLSECFHFEQRLIFEVYKNQKVVHDIIRAQFFAEIRFRFLSSDFVTFLTKQIGLLCLVMSFTVGGTVAVQPF